MGFEVSQRLEITYVLSEFQDLGILFIELSFQSFNLLSHQGHLISHFLWSFLDYFIQIYSRFDRLCFLSEIKSFFRFVRVCFKLVKCTNDSSLGISLQRISKNSGQFGVSKVDVRTLGSNLPSLSKFIDDIAESQQASVNVVSFSPLDAVDLTLSDTFGTRKIYEVDFRTFNAHSLSLGVLFSHLNLNTKHGMRSTTLLINSSVSYFSDFMTFFKIMEDFFGIFDLNFR